MLEVFAMFSDERWAKLSQLLAKLRNCFGANQIFDRLFRRGVRVDVYLELERDIGSASKAKLAKDKT